MSEVSACRDAAERWGRVLVLLAMAHLVAQLDRFMREFSHGGRLAYALSGSPEALGSRWGANCPVAGPPTGNAR